ncbi:DUF883 family protein [Devosia sp.]|uniref:DUF883 family protein n=1 Tax=Devosia sp. TaxID=1871048 RepID=UPI002EE316A4
MAATPEMAPSRKRRPATASRTTEAPAKDESLEAQVARLQEDIKGIAASIAGIAEDRLADARGMARRETRNLVRSGQQAVEGMTDEVGQLEKQLKDAIREKPLTAVAGAVAVGFLLAMITR